MPLMTPLTSRIYSHLRCPVQALTATEDPLSFVVVIPAMDHNPFADCRHAHPFITKTALVPGGRHTYLYGWQHKRWVTTGQAAPHPWRCMLVALMSTRFEKGCRVAFVAHDAGHGAAWEGGVTCARSPPSQLPCRGSDTCIVCRPRAALCGFPGTVGAPWFRHGPPTSPLPSRGCRTRLAPRCGQ